LFYILLVLSAGTTMVNVLLMIFPVTMRLHQIQRWRMVTTVKMQRRISSRKQQPCFRKECSKHSQQQPDGMLLLSTMPPIKWVDVWSNELTFSQMLWTFLMIVWWVSFNFWLNALNTLVLSYHCSIFLFTTPNFIHNTLVLSFLWKSKTITNLCFYVFMFLFENQCLKCYLLLCFI